MSDKIELLPCPFCGEQLHINQRKHNPFARCATPGCTGGKLPLLNIELPDDIAAWNRRAALTKQPAPAAPAPVNRMCPTMQRPVTDCGCPDCGSSLIEWPAPAAQEPVAWVCTARKQGVTEQRSLWSGEQGADIWLSHFIDRGCEVTKTPLYTAPPTVTAAQEPIKLSDEVRDFLQEWIDSATGGEDADVDYGFANQLAVLLGPLYTAPPAAEQPGLPELLIALGEKGVAVNGGTHGDKWKVSLPSAEQPDTVKMRDLLKRYFNALDRFDREGPVSLVVAAAKEADVLEQELRALLGKEGA